MNRRDIVIGIVILAAVAGVIFFRNRNQTPEEEMKVPQALSVEDTIEERFNLEIPEDVDKAELKDVSGGNSSAMATRKVEEGKFTHTILADLPDPEPGKAYSAELVKGEESMPTGSLSAAKGGYLLEFESGSDLNEYNKVKVNLGETTVLEGDF